MTTDWDGDALGRKPIANFLHRYLVRKYEASTDDESICFAIDGDWGTGKTFFVTKWSNDVEDLQHPVIRFDAWKNDLSDQPLMGFIGSLQNGLKQWHGKMPVGQVAAREGQKISGDMVRKAGRAVLPMSGFVAKALIKKLSGIGLDELIDLVESTPGDDGTEVGSGTREQIKDGALDKFFEASIEEHASRLRAIDELKGSVRELLTYLEDKREAKLPMFVFIDELDRCRPNYAIELLEGVKHLFDVRGLCFCFSTNIAQLSESIKGVYGNGFDASKYLKRFFSFEYVLPEPENEEYVSRLVRGSLLGMRKRFYSGLLGLREDASVLSKIFYFVAQSFNLDLRSQRQVFEIADAASAGINDGAVVHPLFLFSLAALRHLDRRTFDRFDAEEFDSMKDSLASLIDVTRQDEYQYVNEIDEGDQRSKMARSPLELILWVYSDISKVDLKDLEKRRPRSGKYPRNLWTAIAMEIPQQYERQQSYPPSIRHYHRLIRTAGQIADRKINSAGSYNHDRA